MVGFHARWFALWSLGCSARGATRCRTLYTAAHDRMTVAILRSECGLPTRSGRFGSRKTLPETGPEGGAPMWHGNGEWQAAGAGGRGSDEVRWSVGRRRSGPAITGVWTEVCRLFCRLLHVHSRILRRELGRLQPLLPECTPGDHVSRPRRLSAQPAPRACLRCHQFLVALPLSECDPWASPRRCHAPEC